MGDKIKIPDLKVGSSGPAVRAVQNTLKAWGSAPMEMNENGVFDSATDKAVRKFQDEHQLHVDGVVGPETRRTLYPVGVTTMTVLGMRLTKPELKIPTGGQRPNLLPGRLTLDPMPHLRSKLLKTRPDYELTRLPGFRYGVPTPTSPDILSPIPAMSPQDGSSCLPGWEYGHKEVQPGTQTMIPIGGKVQNTFTFTAQSVCLLGPDDGAHVEHTSGWQAGAPMTSPDKDWTVTIFTQVTDVDRFGALGHFHWWQPYGQLGAQFGGAMGTAPQLTLNAVPINLTWDATDTFSLNTSGGLALNFDLSNGHVVAGPVLTAGFTFKWDFPTKKVESNGNQPTPTPYLPGRGSVPELKIRQY